MHNSFRQNLSLFLGVMGMSFGLLSFVGLELGLIYAKQVLIVSGIVILAAVLIDDEGK